MTYIENIYICMAGPVIVGMLCSGKRYRTSSIFVLAGMTMCLLSAYVNTFLARFYGADILIATTEVAPVVEEIMKLLPLLFFLMVFEPDGRSAKMAVITIAASFATFENICYLVQNDAGQLSYLLIRGFGTGSMHIVCGAIVGYGMLYEWQTPLMRAAATIGLLCTAIVYHAIFNLFISAGEVLRVVAYVLPVFTALTGSAVNGVLQRRKSA